MAPIYLAALGLIIAPVFAAPTPIPQAAAPVAPTCDNNFSDDKTYIAANAHFKIECDTDYYGNDIAAPQFPTFEECIVSCDATAGCVAVSYVGDHCYQKGAIADTSSAQVHCWTARHFFPGEEVIEEEPVEEEPQEPFSCIDGRDNGKTYRTTKGVFTVDCGVDYAGNDISGSVVNTFEECIDDCAATAGCVNVAYVWGSCYKKSKSGTPSPVGHVWSAKLAETPAEPVEPEEPVSTALSCIDKKDDLKSYTAPSGDVFTIECGVDYAGGDLAATTVDTFEACIAACDANTECIDVSYVWGACYMKSSLVVPAIVRDHVWTAKAVIPEVPSTLPSSTTSESVTSPTTTSSTELASSTTFATSTTTSAPSSTTSESASTTSDAASSSTTTEAPTTTEASTPTTTSVIPSPTYSVDP